MAKINYSKKDILDEDEFHPEYAKEKISIWLDEKIVDEFRKRAKATGAKYQSLMNQALKEAAFPPKEKNLDEIIDKLESASKELKSYKRKAS